MVTKEQAKVVKSKALEIFEKAQVVLTQNEKDNMELADFGLNDIENYGLQIVTLINTERYCLKEMVLLPYQTCPEHGHTPIGGYVGKEETVRCRYGKALIYVQGEITENPQCKKPEGIYTVWHEIELNPGDMYTVMPGVLHWLQGGEKGALLTEVSTKSRDEYDMFSDNRVVRVPKVEL